MISRISAFFQQAKKIPRRREIDSEHEQALLRVVFALVIFIYLFLVFNLDKNSPTPKAALIFSGIFFVYAALLERVISFTRQPSETRQLLTMVADLSALTLVMLMTKETGALFYGIYLWVIVGNGIRYSTRALIRAQIVGVIGFTGVILTNDYWSTHIILGVGLLLTLILIPLYTLKLLERLNQAIIHAEEASKAKTHFLAHMSHEMRTPLNGVIGASDLILGTPLNAVQKDLVQTLRNSGQMLLKLIENVLDFSKIESGKLVGETVDFDLHELVNGIMDMFATQAEQKGLRLHTHFSAETFFLLRGDALHVRQVIINLVGNAIKFTNKGMVELRVSTLTQDETTSRLRFEVIDTGIGIAQELQHVIFESFTQADAAITRIYGGTGLGTTIAKQLVQFMGGQIGLTSEVGTGSVFWFELPFEKQPSNHILDAMPTLREIYVFGVGMKTGEQTAIANYIAGWGGRLYHASSLAKCFSHLTRISPNGQQNLVTFCAPQGIVLCAPQGIEMGAKEFAAHVWEKFSRDDVSLILLDSDIYGNNEEELLEMGYSCFLNTPIDKTFLFNALHGVAATQPAGDVISFIEHYGRNLKKVGVDILVADDNGTNRKIISKILERGGHRVDLVENGDEALDLLENKQYGLAILDMYMPVMGGLEAAKIYRITACHEPQMPIIILTANATTEARRECEEAGIDAFLTKPIDALTLLDSVARLTATANGHGCNTAQDDEGCCCHVRSISPTSDQITSKSTGETTSHSTRLPKDGKQVAGYRPSEDFSQVAGYSTEKESDDVSLRDIKDAGSTERATALSEPAIKQGGVLLLNEDTLRHLKLLGEGGDFVDTVVQGFISEGEQLLEAMGIVLLKHEYGAFKELAHTLKGSAGNVGADALFQDCREILQLNHADLQVFANSLLGKAKGSFSASKQAMIRYLETSNDTVS